MVINDLFSDNAAKNINHTASVAFGKHLFVFCEYEPGSLTPLSPDGKYIAGVLNLYKMFIDSSVGVQLVKLNRNGLNYEEKRRWEQYIEDIGLLRTNYSHNIGADQDARNKYINWLRRTIRKDQFEKMEDYSNALTILVGMQTTCCDTLIKFINTSNGQLRNFRRKEFISSWEKLIIHYYSKNDYNVFLGQIRIAIINKGVQPNKVTPLAVAMWFQKYYEYKIQRSIDNYQILIRNASIPKDNLIVIQSKIDKNLSDLDTIRNSIVKSLNLQSVEKLRAIDYQRYYCKNLEEKLSMLLDELKRNSFSDPNERLSNITMLPSSILQLLIKKDFADIPAT